MGTLIFYGIIAAAALAAFGGFVLHERNAGADAQKQRDAPIIAKAKADLVDSQAAERQREAETAQCQAATKLQSDAVAAQQKLAADAQAKSAAEIVKAKSAALASAEKLAALQAFAGSSPQQTSCQATLAKADQIARDAARERRK